MRNRNGNFEFEGGWRRARDASIVIAHLAQTTARHLTVVPTDEPVAFTEPLGEGFDVTGEYHFPDPPLDAA